MFGGIGVAIAGFFVLLALVFPRPPKKAKGDPKFFASPPKVFLPFAILNQVDRFFSDFFGKRLLRVNLEETLEIAKAAPQSDLFGPQDEILVGIKLFAKGFEASDPSAFGIFANNRYRRINLEKRNQLMEYVVKNPEIAKIEIKRPIIITGMMRTGSTLLYNLLSQDPSTRSPFLWEMAGTNPNIAPPPSSSKDPRIKDVQKAIQTYQTIVPSLLAESAKSHFTGAEEIEECLFALIHQNIHQVISPLSGKEYLEWFLDDKNKEYAYIYLKRFYQMLQSGYAPKSHWVLKAPVHSLYISHLASTFPDALIVITHRDPTSVVGSTAKLFETGSHFHFGENTYDRRWIGEVCLRQSETMCNRIMEHREKNGSENFCDVRYPDLLDDPIGTVKKIYAQAGYEVSEEFERRMKKYLEENPQGKHGRNKYDLELYGLSSQIIEERFAKYRKTYNI